MRVLLLAIVFAACATDPDSTEPDPMMDADPVMGSEDPSQLPPQGHSELVSWIAAGHYLEWACEDAPHPARPPGAHGSNRICSNDALSRSASGTYPVGAASVKELWRNGAITGYAVGIKVTAGTDAASWYWYEAFGNGVIADGVAEGLCANCHADAPRDNVFTHVR